MFSARFVAVPMISSLLEADEFVFALVLFCASAGVATPLSIVVARSSGGQETDSLDFGVRWLIRRPPCSDSNNISSMRFASLAVAPLPHWATDNDYSVTAGPKASRSGPSQRS